MYENNDKQSTIKSNKKVQPVNGIVVARLIEGVVEVERLVVEELGEVHFLLRLMHDNETFVRNCNDINFFALQL